MYRQIIYFFFFICIYANLEKIVFIAAPETYQKQSLSVLSILYTLSKSSSLPAPPTLSSALFLNNPLSLQTQLGFNENQTAIVTTHWFHTQLHIGTVYEIRVCWPASSPANIDIAIFHDVKSIKSSVATFYIQITCKAAYFSLDPAVMNKHLLPLHISKHYL
ncbi:unnamed protein product [Pneumocystis jirovecii]|uniref:Uncharacterized protein n=2 Tax=Pneumocystis jirovecii TaxID=42068 RepID=L0PDS4_PNEJI|nr:uncharacterized protein T551_01829 [Pneumocystis jirovecii RU7]KTW30546.1 hypothetical protein T551_01829 [Pneumocystis jirovecii RU7]CCJ30498.1 unnamed protein product [Pneumocystis jirovecii]